MDRFREKLLTDRETNLLTEKRTYWQTNNTPFIWPLCCACVQKKARHGDPISADLVILTSEIAFIWLKENKNVRTLLRLHQQFSYTTCTDDISFHLSYEKSAMKVRQTFKYFSLFSGLKPKRSNREISGIDVRKEVSRTLLEFVNLPRNILWRIVGSNLCKLNNQKQVGTMVLDYLYNY